MPTAAAAAAAVAVAAKYVAMHAIPIPVVDIIRAHRAIGVKIDPLTAIYITVPVPHTDIDPVFTVLSLHLSTIFSAFRRLPFHFLYNV